MRSVDRQQGMTLLELLISLTLTLIIVSSLYAGMNIGGRAWHSGTAIAEQTSEQWLIRDWLRRQISRMPLIIAEPETGRKLMEFTGEQNFLRFIGELPAHLGGGGLKEMQIQLNEDQELILEYRAYPLTLPDQQRPWQTRVLFDEVYALSIEYYGQPDTESRAEWLSRWSDIEFLPQLVKITILPDRHAEPWPPIIIPLRVDGSTDRPSRQLVSRRDDF